MPALSQDQIFPLTDLGRDLELAEGRSRAGCSVPKLAPPWLEGPLVWELLSLKAWEDARYKKSIPQGCIILSPGADIFPAARGQILLGCKGIGGDRAVCQPLANPFPPCPTGPVWCHHLRHAGHGRRGHHVRPQAQLLRHRGRRAALGFHHRPRAG